MSRRGRGGRNRNHGRHDGGRHHGHGNHQGRQEHRTQEQRPGQSHTQNGAAAQAGKTSFQSAIQPRKTLNRPMLEPSVLRHESNRRYHVIFFDTLAQAKSDLDSLKKMAGECDQLNIVVRAEASMDDPDLTSIGKLFCGAAWALIHERRKADGWYDQPHE